MPGLGLAVVTGAGEAFVLGEGRGGKGDSRQGGHAGDQKTHFRFSRAACGGDGCGLDIWQNAIVICAIYVKFLMSYSNCN